MMQTTARHSFAVSLLVVMALAITGCSLENQAAPSLTGPSEFGLSVTLRATPSVLPRDGSTQAQVSVSIRDDQGRTDRVSRLLNLLVSGPSGTALSQTQVTTANGEASFMVTAPPSTGIGQNSIVVTAVVADSSLRSGTVAIPLTGSSNTSAPAAAFTYLPAAPEVNQSITFDASTTKDEGAACGNACTYSWTFDDGGTANGMIVTHRFVAPRQYQVILTVTDAVGLVSQTASTVAVVGVNAPALTIVSPDPVFVNQQVAFSVTANIPNGHSILSYEWTFGDGTSQITSSGSVIHTYSTIGKYHVTVSATDDLGQKGGASKSITVTYSTDPPVANFVSAPVAPKVNDTVTFSASTSTVGAGATIVSYVWDFGQGTASVNTGTTPAAQAVYTVQGTYVVTLTVTDSLGRVATRTATVTVTP